MDIYTIGFTKKSAEAFFTALGNAKIERLVDVRLNNTSQLAGFAKRDDLRYLLRELVGADYVHEPRLAPTRDLLKTYRSGDTTWEAYELAFLELMERRSIQDVLHRDLFVGRSVLLCSEPTVDRCHRRLVVEYLDVMWGNVRAVDL